MLGTGAAAGSYGDLLVTSLLVLGGVCIAAFVVVRVLGRVMASGRARGAHLLEVVARLPLEPRRSLYVVEVAGKTLLVGTSEMGLSVLSELDGGEVRARAATHQSFGDLVKAAWTRRRGLRDAVVPPKAAPTVAVAPNRAAPNQRNVERRRAAGQRAMTGGVGGAAALALVAIVPLVVLALTSFVKLSVVLSLLRNAIGAPDAPSSLVVTGLSLVLTFFVMAPVAVQMITAAAQTPAVPAIVVPSGAGAGSGTGSGSGSGIGVMDLDGAVRALVPAQYAPEVDAVERAVVPLSAFLAKHADQRDRETFVALATKLGHTVKGDELWVLAPAFITTELREAFAIALLLFLPFIVIDLVVGLGLGALGLQSTSPQAIALPLKLLLFVAVDGWRLLIDALLRGYA